MSDNQVILSEEKELKNFENKVDEVVNILNMLLNPEQQQQDIGMKKADTFLGEDKKHLNEIDIDNFIVKIRDDRTVINTQLDDEQNNKGTQDKQIFMQEMEKDALKRSAERKERQTLAQNLRKMGNQAFRDCEYEKAVNIYNRAIDQVKDSPILYNNRALTYIKLQLYKRAIIDCDFVLNKLDERNLRSWMYRAQGYYLLGEKRNYEKSICEAKKNNPKELDCIEEMINEIEKANINLE